MKDRVIAEVFARLAVLEGLSDAAGTNFLQEALRRESPVQRGVRIHVRIIRGEGH